MKLSYSDYRTYMNCPKLYYNQKNGIKPPERQSEYFSLYGRLIESFFERYTNDLVKKGQALSEGQIRGIIKHQWAWLLEKAYVDWNEPWVKETSDQIYESVVSDVMKNLEAFDFWGSSRAEVPLKILLKKTNDVLTCRMDFIHKAPDGSVEILDGKGTNKIDKNVDVEQLYFYALMYMLDKKRLPDKLGFLYYRYQMIKYIDFDQQTIFDFKDKLALVKRMIKKDTQFKASVGISKQCKWCAYKFNCEAFIEKKHELAEKRASKRKVKTPEFNGAIMSFSPQGETE